MPIEATIYDGKEQILITGMVGQVMDESVKVALSYIKSFQKEFNLSPKLFQNKDLHLHFLEAAIKKDGPSAGVSITTSILSLLLNKEVPKDIAMTGEISLKGDILKVGGLKEKIIGAYNNGVTKVFIPYTNACDLEELPAIIKKKINIILVKNYQEIFNAIFSN